MIIKNYLIAILMLILCSRVTGQYFESGQDPASLKWLRINTGRFEVIYPEKYGSAGQKFAMDLEDAYSDLSKIYPPSKFRIPVIVHNFTTQSNGFVAWAPKRMEVYPTPEQNSVPMSANRQLALHELTHVLQMTSLNSGISKAMSAVFGQQFTGATAALLPLWYLEGDAVFAESVLSGSGRGNSPSFQKELKALSLQNNGLFRYDKMINGSYRDHIPDHYQLGYQMVVWQYYKSGPGLWPDITEYTGRNPFLLNPVNFGLRKMTGLTKKKLFEQAYDSLSALWRSDLAGSRALSYPKINPSKGKDYINYFSPVVAGNDSVYSIKTSMYAPMSIVLINPSTGKEKRAYIPGRIYPEVISSGGNKLVWVETRPDPRWEHRNYSVVVVYDTRSSSARQISFGTRYLAASISGDARLIAVLENSPDNLNSLKFIDSQSGLPLKSIPAPNNYSLQYPRWSDDDKKISMIFLNEQGEGIITFDTSNDIWDVLIDPQKNDIQSATIRGDTLFFVSSVSGTDNIFFRTPGGSVFKVTSSAFGAYDVFASGKDILFSDYSSSGLDICSIPVAEAELYTGERFSEGMIAERFANPGGPAGDSARFLPEPYKKWQHLFGLHSWMPFYADIEEVQSDPASVRPGLTLFSQNHLSTLISSAGYEYSRAGEHVFHTRLLWKGWYPVFDTRIDYGNSTETDLAGENISLPALKPGLKLKNSVYLPLNFTTGKFSHTVYPSISADYKRRYVYLRDERKFDEAQVQLTTRLYLSNYHRSAFRDIYPRWAQVIDITNTTAPWDKKIYGSSLALKTAFYFPGIFRNNGIKLRYESEKQSFARYISSNRANFPRGYRNLVAEKLQFTSADYAFPLAYPDFTVGQLLFLKRVRTSLFYDHAVATDVYYLKSTSTGLIVDRKTEGKEYFNSFGFEILADFHILRIPYPLTSGIQSSWRYGEKTPELNFVFNIDIYGMIIGNGK